MIFDLCLFRPNWKKRYNWDALTKKWSNRINWGNIPFSKPFLIKALIEYLKGENIIFLLPEN
jgi:hypothetical protein